MLSTRHYGITDHPTSIITMDSGNIAYSDYYDDEALIDELFELEDEARTEACACCTNALSCYCTYVLFICIALIAVPLCVQFAGSGPIWNVIAVSVIGALFFTTYMIVLRLRIRSRPELTEIET